MWYNAGNYWVLSSELPCRANVEPGIRPYYPFKTDLVLQDGLLVKGGRLVSPSTMRKEMLNLIHEGHQGIVKRIRATDSVWWSGINGQVEDVVRSCETCIKHQAIRYQPLETATLF